MSNYTDREKTEKREYNREYAEKYLSHDHLIDYYCDYQQLKEDTEFYKENKSHLKASIFFIFVSAYIASCFLLNILNREISLLGMYFQGLLSAAMASFISSILKAPFANSKFFLGKEELPVAFYIILLVLIPLVIRIIF